MNNGDKCNYCLKGQIGIKIVNSNGFETWICRRPQCIGKRLIETENLYHELLRVNNIEEEMEVEKVKRKKNLLKSRLPPKKRKLSNK